EHHDDAFALQGPGSGKSRLYFGRMMSVVVYDSVFSCLQLDLKPPLGSAKRFQCARYLEKRYAKFGGKRDNPQSIADIVAARNTEQNLSERKATLPNLETRSCLGLLYVAILV